LQKFFSGIIYETVPTLKPLKKPKRGRGYIEGVGGGVAYKAF